MWDTAPSIPQAAFHLVLTVALYSGYCPYPPGRDEATKFGDFPQGHRARGGGGTEPAQAWTFGPDSTPVTTALTWCIFCCDANSKLQMDSLHPPHEPGLSGPWHSWLSRLSPAPAALALCRVRGPSITSIACSFPRLHRPTEALLRRVPAGQPAGKRGTVPQATE